RRSVGWARPPSAIPAAALRPATGRPRPLVLSRDAWRGTELFAPRQRLFLATDHSPSAYKVTGSARSQRGRLHRTGGHHVASSPRARPRTPRGPPARWDR